MQAPRAAGRLHTSLWHRLISAILQIREGPAPAGARTGRSLSTGDVGSLRHRRSPGGAPRGGAGESVYNLWNLRDSRRFSEISAEITAGALTGRSSSGRSGPGGGAARGSTPPLALLRPPPPSRAVGPARAASVPHPSQPCIRVTAERGTVEPSTGPRPFRVSFRVLSAPPLGEPLLRRGRRAPGPDPSRAGRACRRTRRRRGKSLAVNICINFLNKYPF